MANQTLVERARKAVVDGTEAKRKRLASLDPDLDDPDYIAAIEANDPNQTLVSVTVGELREFLKANKPGDGEEYERQRELFTVRAQSIRDFPAAKEVFVQACDLIDMVAKPAPRSTTKVEGKKAE